MADYSIPPEAEKQIPPEHKLTGKISRYLLRRYPIWPIIDHLAQKVVPVHKHMIWYNMGGIALFFLLVQIITGLLLMCIIVRPCRGFGTAHCHGNTIRQYHQKHPSLERQSDGVVFISSYVQRLFHESLSPAARIYLADRSILDGYCSVILFFRIFASLG